MSWHMNEKVMVGVIVAMGVNITISLGQAMYVAKTLDTDPPIVERVRVLELGQSALGTTMQRIEGLLAPLNVTLQNIHREQARRKPIVDYVERQLDRQNQ